jgi:hypothetical protein
MREGTNDLTSVFRSPLSVYSFILYLCLSLLSSSYKITICNYCSLKVDSMTAMLCRLCQFQFYPHNNRKHRRTERALNKRFVCCKCGHKSFNPSLPAFILPNRKTTHHTVRFVTLPNRTHRHSKQRSCSVNTEKNFPESLLAIKCI